MLPVAIVFSRAGPYSDAPPDASMSELAAATRNMKNIVREDRLPPAMNDWASATLRRCGAQTLLRLATSDVQNGPVRYTVPPQRLSSCAPRCWIPCDSAPARFNDRLLLGLLPPPMFKWFNGSRHQSGTAIAGVKAKLQPRMSEMPRQWCAGLSRHDVVLFAL